MSNVKQEYLKKRMTPAEVAMYVKSGDVCAAPTGLEEPTAIFALSNTPTSDERSEMY